MKSTRVILFAALATTGACVQTAMAKDAPPPGMSGMSGTPGMAGSKPSSSASMPMSQGAVLKVLPKAVLLKHGPIEAMGMGAMTMQFGVADPKLLKSIKAGDKVRFAVARVGDQVVVTRIEKEK